MVLVLTSCGAGGDGTYRIHALGEVDVIQPVALDRSVVGFEGGGEESAEGGFVRLGVDVAHEDEAVVGVWGGGGYCGGGGWNRVGWWLRGSVGGVGEGGAGECWGGLRGVMGGCEC